MKFWELPDAGNNFVARNGYEPAGEFWIWGQGAPGGPLKWVRVAGSFDAGTWTATTAQQPVPNPAEISPSGDLSIVIGRPGSKYAGYRVAANGEVIAPAGTAAGAGSPASTAMVPAGPAAAPGALTLDSSSLFALLAEVAPAVLPLPKAPPAPANMDDGFANEVEYETALAQLHQREAAVRAVGMVVEYATRNAAGPVSVRQLVPMAREALKALLPLPAAPDMVPSDDLGNMERLTQYRTALEGVLRRNLYLDVGAALFRTAQAA